MLYQMDTMTAVLVLILAVIIILMVIFLIGGIIYQATKGKFLKCIYHDLCDWHIAKFDLGGHARISYCAVCGRLIVKSEDGPWIATKKD